MPLISFIIPVYNAEDYLERCLESVLCQGAEDWEMILVDDESTDSSGSICDRYALRDSRIRVIHRENGGQGVARNTGADAATGEWLCFIDDDDWFAPEMYKECAPFLKPELDILMFNKYEIKAGKITDFSQKEAPAYMEFSSPQEFRELQLAALDIYYKGSLDYSKTVHLVPWGKFIRRSFFKENLQFVNGMGEDRPCMFQAYHRARRIGFINKAYYYYYIHESTMRKYCESAYKKYRRSLNRLHRQVRTWHKEDTEFIKRLRLLDLTYASYCVMQDYCHADNPKPYAVRKSEFLEMLSDQYFRRMSRRKDMKELPLRRRVLAELIRIRQFRLIDILSWFNNIVFNRF